jgi:hypothetical protein
VVALTVVILYALIVRWDDYSEFRQALDQTVDTGPAPAGF